MNASLKTTHIARGVFLWAKIQDQPVLPRTPEDHNNIRQWKEWEEGHKDWVPHVQKLQYNMFDYVNANVS